MLKNMRRTNFFYFSSLSLLMTEQLRYCAQMLLKLLYADVIITVDRMVYLCILSFYRQQAIDDKEVKLCTAISW